MNTKYKFDNAARAERYFVATLLSHLLMADNFEGLKILFKEIFSSQDFSNLNDDFEVVSELDPLRDGSVINKNVKDLYREFKRIAVPDLFLRWDSLCLVIEAKFFTDPASEELQEQIELQMIAIEKVRQYTFYSDKTIKFSILTVNKPRKNEWFLERSIELLTWDRVLQLLGSGQSKSNKYCLGQLKSALKRAKDELSKTPSVTFEKLKYDQLISKIPQLIKDGKIFIGFTGGLEALSNTNEDTLKSRSHYKVSNIPWTENWIPLDLFLHRVFELKGYYEKYADRNG